MSYSILPTDHLLGPRELYGAPSPEIYIQMQVMSIRAKMKQFPFLNWRVPFVHTGKPVPLIVADSLWQLVCGCGGNFPSYDPHWEVAACFSCGAVYRQAPPRDWRRIEEVLVCRPVPGDRHLTVGQTVADLVRENREHGDPVPAWAGENEVTH